MTTALVDSTEHQPRARMALTAALAAGPSHAYLFGGPRGAGKRAAARAFAAEILAAASEDPDDTRRRVLLVPSPHPDLVWLAPSGAQHMVEAVRERVIRAAAYRPFEGAKRVFVIEAAEAMRDESQNALLKTLEEPPDFVHLILISSEPAALLETIASRCQPVEFAPLPVEAVEAALAAGSTGTDSDGKGFGGGGADVGVDGGGADSASPGHATSDEIAAAARLSAGDVDLARFLLTGEGRKLRADVERSAWRALLEDAEAAGEEAEAVARETLEEEAEAGMKRSAREIADEAKRVGRRRRTEVLDLGLALLAAWLRDLAATASGAAEVAFNRDRLAELQAQSAKLDPNRARRAAEQVQDTRRSLDLNVSEELALESLSYRLERALGGE
jgi:DNA polymerase-3 subunit delta'